MDDSKPSCIFPYFPGLILFSAAVCWHKLVSIKNWTFSAVRISPEYMGMTPWWIANDVILINYAASNNHVFSKSRSSLFTYFDIWNMYLMAVYSEVSQKTLL